MNVPLSKSFVILKQIPDKLPNRPNHIITFGHSRGQAVLCRSGEFIGTILLYCIYYTM